MRKKIALDMDEVIADVMPKFLAAYAERYGKTLTKADYWGKKIYDLPGATSLRHILHEKGFFRDLPLMPDCQEVVRELNQRYDVYFTTAAMEFRNSLEDKYDWLQDHFPFITYQRFVFCGDKSILGADYMIDDHVRNLKKFKGKGLLFTSSHNANETGYTRVNNWLEVRDFFANEPE